MHVTTDGAGASERAAPDRRDPLRGDGFPRPRGPISRVLRRHPSLRRQRGGRPRVELHARPRDLLRHAGWAAGQDDHHHDFRAGRRLLHPPPRDHPHPLDPGTASRTRHDGGAWDGVGHGEGHCACGAAYTTRRAPGRERLGGRCAGKESAPPARSVRATAPLHEGGAAAHPAWWGERGEAYRTLREQTGPRESAPRSSSGCSKRGIRPVPQPRTGIPGRRPARRAAARRRSARSSRRTSSVWRSEKPEWRRKPTSRMAAAVP